MKTRDRRPAGLHVRALAAQQVAGTLGKRRMLSAAAVTASRGERELVTMAELEAIVTDYLQQAQTWDAIPAAGPCCLLAEPQEQGR